MSWRCASCRPSVKLPTRLTFLGLTNWKEKSALKKEEISVHFMDEIMSDLKHFEREGGEENQTIIAGDFGQAELEL